MVVSRLRAASRISGADRFSSFIPLSRARAVVETGVKLPDGFPHGSIHALDILDILNGLVHAVFDENLLESPGS